MVNTPSSSLHVGKVVTVGDKFTGSMISTVTKLPQPLASLISTV
ncbi:MAG: hypothetical protein TRG1_2292 [Flavobacteriaceae bacterium FS1-H7996/R]|nr:MAG: hypothetical protein TRG1_2292 [Flavobacteriaceae bacterium FS1-H7996/R]